MPECDIVNSVNKTKWLFREYGALSVTEVFLFDVSVFFWNENWYTVPIHNKYTILYKSPSFFQENGLWY